MKNFLYLPNKNKSAYILLLCFPIFLVLGNLFINIFYILFSIIAILNIKNNIHFYNSKIFYLLIFFLFCLSISAIDGLNPINSFPRILKFILIIFFIKELNNLILNNNKFLEKIINYWIIIFIIISLDVCFELIFGFNSLGFKSNFNGRVSSFFGDELVVGSYFHFFSLIFFSSIIIKKVNNNYIFLILSIIVALSFMIGERANFIRLFFSFFILTFLIIETNFSKKIMVTLIILISLFFIILMNPVHKVRYFYQLNSLFSANGFITYFKESQYGAHQSTAFEIFKKNYLFGIGLKNFRDESKKEIYRNLEYKKTHLRQATHPHQIHLELLSETGLMGYLSFMILIIYSTYFSIKNFLRNRNLYQLSSIIFLVSSLIPILPSGSIFSTFYGGIFWFNFGLMICLNKYSISKS